MKYREQWILISTRKQFRYLFYLYRDASGTIGYGRVYIVCGPTHLRPPIDYKPGTYIYSGWCVRQALQDCRVFHRSTLYICAAVLEAFVDVVAGSASCHLV